MPSALDLFTELAQCVHLLVNGTQCHEMCHKSNYWDCDKFKTGKYEHAGASSETAKQIRGIRRQCDKKEQHL